MRAALSGSFRYSSWSACARLCKAAPSPPSSFNQDGARFCERSHSVALTIRMPAVIAATRRQVRGSGARRRHTMKTSSLTLPLPSALQIAVDMSAQCVDFVRERSLVRDTVPLVGSISEATSRARACNNPFSPPLLPRAHNQQPHTCASPTTPHSKASNVLTQASCTCSCECLCATAHSS